MGMEVYVTCTRAMFFQNNIYVDLALHKNHAVLWLGVRHDHEKCCCSDEVNKYFLNIGIWALAIRYEKMYVIH